MLARWLGKTSLAYAWCCPIGWDLQKWYLEIKIIHEFFLKKKNLENIYTLDTVGYNSEKYEGEGSMSPTCVISGAVGNSLSSSRYQGPNDTVLVDLLWTSYHTCKQIIK